MKFTNRKIGFAAFIVCALCVGLSFLTPGCATTGGGSTLITPAQIQVLAEDGTVIALTAEPQYLPAVRQIQPVLAPFITNGLASPSSISNALALIQLPSGVNNQFGPIEQLGIQQALTELTTLAGQLGMSGTSTNNAQFNAAVAALYDGVAAGVALFPSATPAQIQRAKMQLKR
jgi:hypothetical protein